MAKKTATPATVEPGNGGESISASAPVDRATAPACCAVCGSDDLRMFVQVLSAAYYKCHTCYSLTATGAGATPPPISTDADYARYRKEVYARLGSVHSFELFPLTAEQNAMRGDSEPSTEPLQVMALNQFLGYVPDFRAVAKRAAERIEAGGYLVIIQNMFGDESSAQFALRRDVRADKGQAVIPSREGVTGVLKQHGFKMMGISVFDYITFFQKVA